jgi:dTDP-4-dehydrorhamnose reductase
MRILLTGKNGQLGRCFQDVLKGTNHELHAYGSDALNIADAQQIIDVVQQIKPDIIVNAAAYTAVDKAESDAKNAYLVNSTGPELLAIQAAVLNIPFIHISTDYVFDGNAIEPYQSGDKTNPQSVYGSSKLAGELALAEVLEEYVVLRTSWVFSQYGNNFVKTMVRLAKERDELGVVADQYGCPTYAGDLAQAVLQICNQYEQGKNIPAGVYHYCGDTPTSWHGFARAILCLAKENGLIKHTPMLKAISTDAHPTPAKRPVYSIMKDETLPLFGIVPSDWFAGLNSILKEYNA